MILVTWWFGLPSSSSHALIGGLVGGGLAAADNQWAVITLAQVKEGMPRYKHEGPLHNLPVTTLLA